MVDESGEDNREFTPVHIHLDNGNSEKFIDMIVDKLYNKIKKEELIDNSKVYIDILKEEEEEEEKKKKKTENKHKAEVLKIIMNNKYVTTADIQKHKILGVKYKTSQQAIRLLQKTNIHYDHVILFKEKEENPRSPWICTIDDYEHDVKGKIKAKLKRRSRR